MKIKFLLTLALCLTLTSIIVSCHHHDDDDSNPPVLLITSPSDNASLPASSPVHITGTVTDESLHEMNIKITNDSNGSVLFNKDLEVHDATNYTINESYTPTNITSVTHVTMFVIVSDHSDHEVRDTVHFVLNP